MSADLRATSLEKNFVYEDAHTKVHCVEAHPLCGAFARRRQDPVKLAYDGRYVIETWPVQLTTPETDYSRPGNRTPTVKQTSSFLA